MGDNISEIRNLIDKLNYYTKLYDEGKPEISDQEWDDMYFELAKLEALTGEYFEDSPTQRVNYQVVNQLNKVEHSHPMLSLDKTKDLDVVKSFIGKKDYIVMAKMDGLTCSLTYENGYLVRAETRGNGIIGEDILHNALQVKSIPNRINYKDKLVVDGEIICDYKTFERFSNDYKNPRNFAAGSIRLLDSEESAMRSLTFVAWDLIEGPSPDNLAEKFKILKEFNFIVVPFQWGDSLENEELEHSIKEIQNWCQICEYPIDGIVVKYNRVDEYEAAGRTDHHFKGGIAYKFYDEEYETVLRNIEWTMGRTGVLTPVAIYDDIDIDGTICNRASLHNLSIMKEQLYEPYAGEKIWIAKMNMIIPQVVRKEWIANDYHPGENDFDAPRFCPICGKATEIRQENNSKMLYCSNPYCEGKLLNRIDHFCSKKGLDIKGLSKATIEKLMDWGWVDSIKDIYTLALHKNEWIQKPGFGDASVEKILTAIYTTSFTTLDKVIAAAGIPEIGSRVAKDIAGHYETWTDFRAETNYMKIDGIGEVMNTNLLTFDYTEMDYIVGNYLTIETKQQDNQTNNLEGKTFCVTGKVHIYKNRAELTADIESRGGRVVSSMSSKVDYLVNNDNTSTSAKNIAAQKAGIPIITEEELQLMFT